MPRIQRKKGNLTISGSADAYYRFNFHNAKDSGTRTTIQVSPTHKILLNWEWLLLKPIIAIGKVDGVVDLGFGEEPKSFLIMMAIWIKIRMGLFHWLLSNRLIFPMPPQPK